MACLLASLSQSCAQVNVKRMTYQALRQHECRINEPNTICQRSYSFEYREYERMRQQFLTDKQNGQYRVKLNLSSTDSGYFVQ